MKKLVFLLLLFSSQFGFSNEIKEDNVVLEPEKEVVSSIYDPVQCCTRRVSSGVYGTAGYTQVSVTRCATSTISYQDAQAKACVLAEASAERSLEIAQQTSESVKIGG